MLTAGADLRSSTSPGLKRVLFFYFTSTPSISPLLLVIHSQRLIIKSTRLLVLSIVTLTALNRTFIASLQSTCLRGHPIQKVAMPATNKQDRFNDSLRNYTDFPRNRVRSSSYHQIQQLDSHYRYLEDHEGDLFDDSEAKIQLLEGEFTTKLNQCSSFSHRHALMAHLMAPRRYPMVRHAFIQSQSSLDPLNCSIEMFKSLLTFQQVEYTFLDSVYTFGANDEPQDLCLAEFCSDDTLTVPADDLVELSDRGLSGREIRMSYLLRSVELDQDVASDPSATKIWGWRIRPTAVYHSFDVENGRSFWLNIKGNDLFHTRMQHIQASDEEPVSSFRASLETHLIYLSWCDENWRQLINDFENAISEIVDKARTAQIDNHLKTLGPELATIPRSIRQSRANTTYLPSKGPARKSTSKYPVPGILRQGTKSLLDEVSKALPAAMSHRKKDPDVEMARLGNAGRGDRTTKEHAADPELEMDQFRLADVQTLQKQSSHLERAALAVRLDCETLQELSEYYSGLVSRNDVFPSCEKEVNTRSIRDFVGQVDSIRKRLRIRQIQLEHLVGVVSSGISLVSAALARNIDGRSASELLTWSLKSMTEFCNIEIYTSASGLRRTRRKRCKSHRGRLPPCTSSRSSPSYSSRRRLLL